MARLNLVAIIATGVLLITPPPCLSAARVHSRSGTLLVSLYNDAGASRSVLQRAEDRAAEIFAAAGIEVHWILCVPEPAQFDAGPDTPSCASFTNPSHLSVRIVPPARTLGKDVFGQAILDESGHGVYAKVYYSTRFAYVSEELLDEGAMLGYVIAHEVGHLLLGVNSHSAEGLMCAHWRREELHHASLNFFFFSSRDAANLRSRFAAAEYARGECETIRNPSCK